MVAGSACRSRWGGDPTSRSTSSAASGTTACWRASVATCAAAIGRCVDVDGWPDNRSCEHLVAWTWSSPVATHLVVVNLSEGRADGLVRLPGIDGGPLMIVDGLTGERFERDGDAIRRDGLYVALPGWGVHLLRW